MRIQFDNLTANYIWKTWSELSISDSIICVPVRPVGGENAHNLILI